MASTSGKDIPLEALRGLAAFTVLLWHTMLGFFPQWSGAFPDRWPVQESLKGQPWFGLIYGPAAVTIFFVLSGFVLTRHFLTSGDQQIIVRGVIKRWPRLAGPVLVTVLASWLLLKLNFYNFAEGGAFTGSPWLSAAYDIPPEVSFRGALAQGAFLTLFRGDYFYDGSLWTMRVEFIGSFVSFGLALLIALLPRHGGLLQTAVIAVVLALCYFVSPLYAAFPSGVALAAFLPERRNLLPSWAVGALVVTAIYLSGFSGSNIGAYALIGWPLRNTIFTEILATMILIAAIELAPDVLRSRFSHRFAHFLAPYLFHSTWFTSPYCVPWAVQCCSGRAHGRVLRGQTSSPV